MIDHTVDLTNLPDGKTYEDRYGGYLGIFGEIAALPSNIEVLVKNPPWSWVPLLQYLNCGIVNPREVFTHCGMVRAAIEPDHPCDRTAIEVLCGFRPETVDALYKVDREWKSKRVKQFPFEKDFLITTTSGFQRKEVVSFIDDYLRNYVPPSRKVVITPCAADKPYPAPLHKAVLEMMPSDFYLATATGALGLVPQELWQYMPHYDAGIPNDWRMFQVFVQYFQQNYHTHIVVYCDYQTPAILSALRMIGAGESAIFVNGTGNPMGLHNPYLDLMAPSRLLRLRNAFELCKDEAG